ncbi:MAG TPA: hypothetical protein PLD47_11295 [Aggregatilineales bacterium]|nr:hypothetical protein [Anaerolineales bacterium]HRE48302.1 hypothetical protein [Aggregatilineales bacterium]
MNTSNKAILPIRRRLVASLAALLLFGLFTVGGFALYNANPPVWHSFPSIGYGVHAFLWWDETTRVRDLEFIRQMRFQYVKQIFGWKDIFPAPNLPAAWTHADVLMDEADYRGIQVIARLGKPPESAIRPAGHALEMPPFDETAFGEFCGAVAARYKGRIKGYQVWNEPNLDREWGDRPPNAAAYVKLLAACHTAIKRVDPAAVVITAGLAPTGTWTEQAIPDDIYLKAMYAAGAAGYYDVLGVNAPGYKSPPETAPDDPALNGQRWQAFRHVEDIRQIMRDQGEGHKQIAILEMGWTVDDRDTITTPTGEVIPNPYRWHAVTESEQADYLVRAYDYAGKHWRPWISLMITIYIADISWTAENEEYWWALTLPGYTPLVRESFIALANSARYINDAVTPPIGGADNPYQPLPPRPTGTPK